MKITLNSAEIAELFWPHPRTRGDAGFHSLLGKLQSSVDQLTGQLNLTPPLLGRIPRYAFDHGNADWERRLKAIFARSLGSGLGR